MPGTDRQATSVLLVDDHPLMRKGLRALLENEPGIIVTGEAADGEQAIEQARLLVPDVIIMDISMPQLNGIEATRRILKDLPATRVIALSIHSEKRLIDEMLLAGSAAYLLKDRAPDELVCAIHAVKRGESFLGSAITDTVIDGYLQHEADKRPGVTVEAPLVYDASVDLLQTKLQRPSNPGDLVWRGDLMARLDNGRNRPLTLVSAPAGYGKSVLISSWLEQSDWSSAWLSLDSNDSSLRQFLTYFISALQTVFPQACTGVLELVKAVELPSLPNLASTLVNELNALDKPVLVTLDDYHLIDAQSPVNALLQWMLEHPAIPLHLIIITRRDPPIPLVSMRASGQVNEVRTLDLQFGENEARALLKQASGHTVSDAALANLEHELEGWVAGLRLVSLALLENDDSDEFLMRLHGGVQQTQEFLVHEVINKQPPVLREWLLKSAILDRFSASLCGAVCTDPGEVKTHGYDGSSFIRQLSDANLFVIQLDAQGEWFRYHHLFQAMLKHELSRWLTTHQVAELHLRAANWFETQGMLDEAIQHALESGEAHRAAEIVERHWRTEIDRDRWYVVRKWLDLLPAGPWMHGQRIVLAEMWTTMCQQRFDRLPALVEKLESSLNDEAVDPEIHRDLNYFHGMIEYWQGNSRNSLVYLEHTLTEISDQPGIIDGWMCLYYGLALCMNGKQALASKTINDQIQGIGTSGHYRSQLIGTLVFIQLLSGKLTEARTQTQRLALLAQEYQIANTESWSDYLLGTIEMHRLELDQAVVHFTRAVKQRYVLEPKASLEALAGLALSQMLMGYGDDAAGTLEKLLGFARERNDPQSLSVADSCVARLQILRGDLAQAVRWARSVSASAATDELFSWLEVPSITRARVLLASGSGEALKEAEAQLLLIRQQSDRCHYICQTIEVAVLQSLLLEKQGRRAEALEALAEAVALAEPGGWVRPFIEPGQPMAELLGCLSSRQQQRDFVSHLLGFFQAQQVQFTSAAGDVPRDPESVRSRVADTLTKRELEILELIMNRLQNKEMAERLFVSPETVKTHLKHLYQKLEVSNRREAAEKARQILRPS